MWEKRFDRFPEHTPINKEYFLLREIFELHYPKKCALDTIPKGLSIACSTPEAICWDASWENLHDISGRAVSFHSAADAYASAAEMSTASPSGPQGTRARAMHTVKAAPTSWGSRSQCALATLAVPRVPRAPRQRPSTTHFKVSI
jgi:hypothetical protein